MSSRLRGLNDPDTYREWLFSPDAVLAKERFSKDCKLLAKMEAAALLAVEKVAKDRQQKCVSSSLDASSCALSETYETVSMTAFKNPCSFDFNSLVGKTIVLPEIFTTDAFLHEPNYIKDHPRPDFANVGIETLGDLDHSGWWVEDAPFLPEIRVSGALGAKVTDVLDQEKAIVRVELVNSRSLDVALVDVSLCEFSYIKELHMRFPWLSILCVNSSRELSFLGRGALDPSRAWAFCAFAKELTDASFSLSYELDCSEDFKDDIFALLGGVDETLEDEVERDNANWFYASEVPICAVSMWAEKKPATSSFISLYNYEAFLECLKGAVSQVMADRMNIHKMVWWQKLWWPAQNDNAVGVAAQSS